MFEPGHLSPALIAKLKFIRDNREHSSSILSRPGSLFNKSTKGRPQYYVQLEPGVGNPKFLNEYAYPESPFPDAGVRLLALYRYWNIIRYFFPYRHLIGEDWNNVLAEEIPAFCGAGDALAYQLACKKLIVRVQDSHADLWEGGDKIEESKGSFSLPLRVRFLGDSLVVTGIIAEMAQDDKIKPGDIISAIDGVPVKELIQRYLPLTAGSNFPTQLRNMKSWLLRNKKQEVSLDISSDGQRKSVTLRAVATTRKDFFKDDPSKVGYRILPGNIGYLYPGLLTNNSFDSVKAMLHGTKGLVIDFRCYPGTFTTFTYARWLKPAASPFVRFTHGTTDLPGLFLKTGSLSNGSSNREAYKGKVVIIVDEKTQSSAEYQTMAFQTIPGAVTIGSTTAGADGNVSTIVLPGGLLTMISGIGILYPDGSETQGKGVRIDRVMHPTVQGIREGRDELLDEAVRIIDELRASR